MNTAFQILKDTYSEWSEDKAPRLAAALAYYAMFALAPLLIIVIAIAGLVFGEEARAQQGMPRRDDQGLRERQVGGEEIEHTAAEPPPRADSRLGLLASFLVGLVIGRRNKRP